MKLKAFTFSLFFLLLAAQFSFGQSQAAIDRTKEELSGPLEEQFQYILDNSYDYTTDDIPFEVIKNRYLQAFKAHLIDSLNQLQKQIDNHDNVVNQLNAQIDSSNQEIAAIKSTNQELSTKTTTISVLRFPIEKSLFKILVLVLIIILALVIFLLSSKLKSANEIVNDAKHQADKANEEQERFRRTSMEREQKLKREILNLNKKSTPTLSSNSSTSTVSKKEPTTKKKDSDAKKSSKK